MTHVLLGVVTRLAGGGSATGIVAGSVDGVGSAAYFRNPAGLALSTSGTIYVADRGNHLIRVISPTGTNNRILEKDIYFQLLFILRQVW